MNPFGVPRDAANLTMHRAAAGVRRSPVCVPAGKQVYGDGRPHAGERAAERLVAEYSTCLYPSDGICCEQYDVPPYCDVDSDFTMLSRPNSDRNSTDKTGSGTCACGI